MSFLLNSETEVFAFLVCSILLFDFYQRREKRVFEDKLFLVLLVSNMLILLIDAAGWYMEGQAISLFSIVYVRTVLFYFIMNPLLPYLWLLYIDYQIFKDETRLGKLFWPYLLPILFSTLMVIANPFNQMLFYIDSNNVYHRGPWYPLFIALSLSYLLYAFILPFLKRRMIPKNYFVPLVIFPLPPIIGAIIQSFFYGTALIWTGLTLSLLIIYIYVQNRKMDTDYLTGLYNRRQLDRYLEHKIKNITAGQKFSAIMIDIDGFKQTNDQYGHVTGDEALEITTQLLKSGLRKHDFLARYGGDEFMIIVDIEDKDTLIKFVKRINEEFTNFNLTEVKPYKLNVSMGYDIYDYNTAMSADSFIQHIDALMYADKKGK